jgi:peptidoglycan/LPS O-acetylase OafA/YrhL
LRDRVTLLVVLIALPGGVSLAYKWWTFDVAHTLQQTTINFGPVARADAFAGGMVLAVLAAWQTRPIVPGRLAPVLRLIGLLIFVGATLCRDRYAIVWAYFHTLCALASMMILLPALFGPGETLWEGLLARRAPQFLGRVSYSLYLWQEISILLLTGLGILSGASSWAYLIGTLTTVLLTCAIATLSYRIVETPALRLQRRFSSNAGPAKDSEATRLQHGWRAGESPIAVK